MKYVALLRGINAGKLRRVEMKRLKALIEDLGYGQVSTYLNSGNVLFEADGDPGTISRKIEAGLKEEFGFDIPTLVKTGRQMRRIARAIPDEWLNDSAQRTDVAYLFEQIDSGKTLDEAPVNREFIDIRYTKGALFWNIDRKNYNKSRINNLIGHEMYQFMTVRNVNTARFLAGARQPRT